MTAAMMMLFSTMYPTDGLFYNTDGQEQYANKNNYCNKVKIGASLSKVSDQIKQRQN